MSTESTVWCDLAPWLASRGDDPDFAWIDDEVAATDPAVRRAHGELIAVLMAETLPEMPIGELLPLLPGDVDLIPDENLPTRAANWLLSTSVFTTDRIRRVSPGEILNSRGMGSGSVVGLLARLVEIVVDALLNESGQANSEISLSRDQVLDDLTTIARWRALTGSPETALLTELPPHAPAAVHEAHSRLHALTAESPAVTSVGPLDVPQRLSEQLSGLPDRDREVFVLRRLAEDRPRLESLGEHYGVTRERVRQYEVRALDELHDWLDADPDAQFLLTAAVRLIGTVRPLDDLLRALPTLGDPVPAAGYPLWRVLIGIGVGFEIADGWAATPGLDEARAATTELLAARADAFGVVDADVLRSLAGDVEAVDPSWPQHWAAELGAVIYRDRILTRTSSVEDYAAALLQVHGEPRTPDELVASFHTERSARTLVNQMIGDDRFHRVSRTHWGLSSWGGRAYETIRAAIGTVLDESGGSAPLATIVAQLTEAYDVKASSVTSYAGLPPFQTVDGIVSRGSSAPQPRKSPAQTRNLYRVGDAWKLRVRVNGEHRRGSGSPLPVALATALGLAFGETRLLATHDGEQHLSWTAVQPSLGSTRRFFASDAMADVVEVFFVFTDAGRFDVEPASSISPAPTTSGLGAALAAIGADPADSTRALEVLARAVGLAPTSSVDQVREALAARGEADLAAVLDEAESLP